MPLVYAFDHKHRRPPKDQKDLLGGKGANLAEMTSVLGLPVPPGFTITTDACRSYLEVGWPDGLDAEVTKAVRRVERDMGKTLGDPEDPLLVSVRSGAKFSMPGMMDTVLNLGLNDRSVEGLAAQTQDERFAYDSYRRFIAMYARIVLDLDGEEFDHLLDGARRLDRVEVDAAISARTLRRLCERYQDIVEGSTGEPFPQDPAAQLRGAIEAVFQSWGGARAVAYRQREHIPNDLGTAVNVQAMVFGNRDDQSGTGVGFTRNASTGENAALRRLPAQRPGRGRRGRDPQDRRPGRAGPALPRHLTPSSLKIFAKLERHYRDMCDTEFTIEQGKLWMLQTRVGKRTGAAALRMAVEMTAAEGLEAHPGRGSPPHHRRAPRPGAPPALCGRASGRSSPPGCPRRRGRGSARCTSRPTPAWTPSDRGEDVILVRIETSPEDVHGMQVAEGILTARGGLVSHAAVVARGWGIPAVVGAEAIEIEDDHFTVGDVDRARGRRHLDRRQHR